jgi:hypothetical protein
MIPTLVSTLVLALIQLYIHRRAQAQFDTLKGRVLESAGHVRDVKAMAYRTAATTELSYDLVHKAVTQLPKTRSRKTKAAGIGETEQEA